MWGLDIRTDPAGGYRWQLWASDGRRSATSSEAFRARYNAHRAADLFRDNARELEYRTEQDGPGEYRWVATDGEGQVVAVSAVVYGSPVAAEHAAEQVRRRAAMAVLN